MRSRPAPVSTRTPVSSSASRAVRAPASPPSRAPCATGCETEGFPVVLTFEPGDTEVGRKVRQIVLDPATGELSHRTESLLYAADKAEHVDTVVLPALGARRGRHHRPVRRLDAGLPGRRPRPRRRRASRRSPAGRRGDLRPHLTVRPRPRRPRRGWAGSRAGTGSRGSRRSSTSGSGRPSSRWPSANPEHYLVLDARRPVDELADAVRGAGPAVARPGPAGASDDGLGRAGRPACRWSRCSAARPPGTG